MSLKHVMRHGKNSITYRQHRKSMLANMACSLIEHKRIIHFAKAKALKQFVEPLITKSKVIRRTIVVFVLLTYVVICVTDLFRDVAAKVGDRPGGYTRIIKVGNRLEIMLIWQ
jgi:large subunit ribosomal protein L17